MTKKFNPFFAIITILSLVAVSLLTIDYLNKNNIDILSNASGDNVPREVLISDLNHDSAVVNWYTTKDTSAFVKVLKDGKEVNTLFASGLSKYHRIEITNLISASNYEVVINSDGTDFNGIENTSFITTAIEVDSSSFPVYGQIFDNTGVSLLKEGLIAIELDNGEQSQIYTTTINIVGGYQFNLEDLKVVNTGRAFDREKSGVANITIYNVQSGIVKKTVPYDFTKSRQFLNIVAGEEEIEQIPGINGQL